MADDRSTPGPEVTENGWKSPWRRAVWSLRSGYLSLMATIAGLILLGTGGTPWVLGIGVLAWLLFAGFTLSQVIQARNLLPDPKPGWWKLRWNLIEDSLRPSRST